MKFLFIIFGIVIFIVGAVLFALKRPSTQATVTSIVDTCRIPIKRNFCRITVKYNVKGKDYTGSLKKNSYFGKVGDKIKIEYNASDPSQISNNNAFKIAGGILITIGFFVALYGFFAV